MGKVLECGSIVPGCPPRRQPRKKGMAEPAVMPAA